MSITPSQASTSPSSPSSSSSSSTSSMVFPDLPSFDDFARLRLSSPPSIRPNYPNHPSRPKPLVHRRAYSCNHSFPSSTSSTTSSSVGRTAIRIPLIRRDSEPPRILPPMRTSPPPAYQTTNPSTTPITTIPLSSTPLPSYDSLRLGTAPPSARSIPSTTSSSSGRSTPSTISTLSSGRSTPEIKRGMTRKILISDSLAKHLRNGGVVRLTDKEGRKVEMYLPTLPRV